MGEPVVCIFPHSDDEFTSADELRNFLCDRLPAQPEGRYLLGKLRRKDKNFKARVIQGSIVLFLKKGLVVGQATIQNAIRELDPPVDGITERGIPVKYYHEVIFAPQSIIVYRRGIPVEKLKQWSGRSLEPPPYAILGTKQECEEHFKETVKYARL